MFPNRGGPGSAHSPPAVKIRDAKQGNPTATEERRTALVFTALLYSLANNSISTDDVTLGLLCPSHHLQLLASVQRLIETAKPNCTRPPTYHTVILIGYIANCAQSMRASCQDIALGAPSSITTMKTQVARLRQLRARDKLLDHLNWDDKRCQLSQQH